MNKDRFCIEFTAEREGELFSVKNGGAAVMECTFIGGILDFWIAYDYKKDEPLHLKSNAKSGDKIKINIMPHRIELYVDGILKDEEWPCGKHFLTDESVTDGNCNVVFCDLKTEKVCEPCVLGSFRNAEGWKPGENVYVGDCMPYVHEGRYHVLYLKDRHHHTSKWNKGAHQWSHISTADFVNWDIHPMAVEIDSPEEGSICTGSWIFDGTLHRIFYTVRACDDSPAKICRSVSKDGYHFEKDRGFSFALSDKYTASSARDPKIIRTDDGLYHMILTTSLAKGQKGCLAHLVSKDMNEWQELEEPLYTAPVEYGEPECPDYFYKDGFYYLIYSLQGKGYYMYSKNPFSGWQTAENPIIPCKSVPKAAVWNNRLIFTGFSRMGGYGGTMTFLEAVVLKNGELAYKNPD